MKRAAATLRLSANVSAVEEAARTLASLAEALPRLSKLVDRLLSLTETGEKLFAVEANRAATASADHLVVRANPTDLLRVLVPAVRAWDAQLSVIEELLGHGESSIGRSHADGGMAARGGRSVSAAARLSQAAAAAPKPEQPSEAVA